jgi:hypothetical protein
MNKTPGMALDGSIGTGGARRMNAAYAQLTDRATGSKLWQIAAHTIAHIWRNPNLNRKVQQEQFGALGALASRLGQGGVPVFVGGDLNNDPRNIEGSRPGGKQGMGNFAPLTGAGLKTNWTDEFIKKNAGGTMGGRFIDHLMYNSAVKLLDTNAIGGLHSDHKAVISKFSLPQLKTGGDIMFDNTLANLHHDEKVLTARNSKDLDRGLENLANGAGAEYNVNVYVTDAGASAEEIANVVDARMRRRESRLPRSR